MGTVFGPAGPGAMPPAPPPPRQTALQRWSRGCPCCAYLRALLALGLVALAAQLSFIGLQWAAMQAPVCEGYMSDRGECG